MAGGASGHRGCWAMEVMRQQIDALGCGTGRTRRRVAVALECDAGKDETPDPEALNECWVEVCDGRWRSGRRTGAPNECWHWSDAERRGRTDRRGETGR